MFNECIFIFWHTSITLILACFLWETKPTFLPLIPYYTYNHYSRNVMLASSKINVRTSVHWLKTSPVSIIMKPLNKSLRFCPLGVCRHLGFCCCICPKLQKQFHVSINPYFRQEPETRLSLPCSTHFWIGHNPGQKTTAESWTQTRFNSI